MTSIRLLLPMVLGVWPMAAASIGGTVLSEWFDPLPASITLTLEVSPRTVRSAVTDERGSFKYFGLIPGRYTLDVRSQGFKAIQVRNVLIAEGEDRQLRRFLLRVGQSFGNCTPLVEARFQVQHSGADDVEIGGVIANGSGTSVKLIVFGEDRRSEKEALTDNEGRFRFQVPMSGDVRLDFRQWRAQ